MVCGSSCVCVVRGACGAWCLVRGVVGGVWCVVCGMWCVVFGARRAVRRVVCSRVGVLFVLLRFFVAQRCVV